MKDTLNEKIKLLTQSYLTLHGGDKAKKIPLFTKSKKISKEKKIPMIDTFFGNRKH